MKTIRIISGCLALLQLGWAAALTASSGSVPRWAIVVGAVIAAIGTAGPGILEGMVKGDDR